MIESFRSILLQQPDGFLVVLGMLLAVIPLLCLFAGIRHKQLHVWRQAYKTGRQHRMKDDPNCAFHKSAVMDIEKVRPYRRPQPVWKTLVCLPVLPFKLFFRIFFVKKKKIRYRY